MAGLFPDITTTSLEKCLDGIAIRQRTIADNIANVETPGFKRSDVSFEDQLKQAMEAGDDQSAMQQINEVAPETQVDNVTPGRPDGNNVSIDKEMSSMVKNTMQYEALVQLMNLKTSMLRAAISEGKR